MLGSLFASALAVAFAQQRFPEDYAYPMKFRMLFVGVIGAMIGAQLTPDVAALLPQNAGLGPGDPGVRARGARGQLRGPAPGRRL